MNNIQKLVIYLKMSVKAVANKTDWNTIQGTIAYFPSWQKYLLKDTTSVQPIPWLSFNAISHLKKLVRPDMVVFEFGSGGSTLFWSKHVTKVISIEHEPEWYHRMKDDFNNRNLRNVDYNLITPEPDGHFYEKSASNPDHYISSDIHFKGKNFESYVRHIDKYPDGFFDIVVVDGRARPSCIAHAVKKIKNGGLLILDNSERKHYAYSLQQFTKTWDRRDFLGPVPYSYNFSQTTIAKKIF
jgi:hypothetical protein